MAGEASRLKYSRRAALAGAIALPLLSCRPLDEVTAKPKRATQAADPKPRAGQLVELVQIDPTIRLDIRYATSNNFTGRQLYDQPRAFLVRPAADALARAHRKAMVEGFGLCIFDAYRPWRITKALWDATPPGPKRNYVANPKKGSKHNRGCAVDLTLFERTSGSLVEMPSGYDEFSPRAHRSYTNAAPAAIANRARLEHYMQDEGFIGISNEWWHFDFTGWENYPILDIAFDNL